MPVSQCSKGKWRIGSGPCVYESKASAERAWRAYLAQKSFSEELEKLSFASIKQRIGMLASYFVQMVWSSTQGEYLAAAPPEEIRYEWMTVGDDRTCPVCEPNDGKMFDSMETVMMQYPAHANCRCWIEVRKTMPYREGSRFQWTPPDGW